MESDKPLVSRKEALERGLPTYFTGKPCKHGHMSERFVGQCYCVECDRERGRSQDKKERRKELRKNNPEQHRLWEKTYRERYPERIREKSRVAYLANPRYYSEKRANRRAAQLQRTPEWADREAIKEIYHNCPQGMHVDHIIPLQGETVSGLHVPENLQYLTPQENAAKGNSYVSE